MHADQYWQLFLDTGAPEAYLLFNVARRSEDIHVFDNQRTGTEGIRL